MQQFDAIIVGGGPAGSSCASELVRAGMDVVVLDREAFPRSKLCAGWITPDVVRDLARAAEGRTFTFPGEATRLQRVLDALSDGQILPPHECLLHDPPETWPAMWREVLETLNVTSGNKKIWRKLR